MTGRGMVREGKEKEVVRKIGEEGTKGKKRRGREE